jgi:hypothetical protein
MDVKPNDVRDLKSQVTYFKILYRLIQNSVSPTHFFFSFEVKNGNSFMTFCSIAVNYLRDQKVTFLPVLTPIIAAGVVIIQLIVTL